MSAMQPRLPPELERLIFELAATQDKSTAHNLTFVSRRAQIWVEPILYNKIALISSFSSADSASKFLDAVKLKPANFLAKHVKSLAIELPLGSPDVDISSILSVCSGLEAFGYCSPHRYPYLIHHFNKLSLTRLAIDPSVLSGDVRLDWSQPYLHRLTHLELCSFPNSIPKEHLSNFSTLQYLSFGDFTRTDAIETMLSDLPNLKGLVFVNYGNAYDDSALKPLRSIRDPRFIIVSDDGWRDSWTNDMSDCWSAVAKVIEKQVRDAVDVASHP